MRTERIRLATPEEVEKISKIADLTPSCRVLARGDTLAVWRICHELDPVIFAENSKPADRYMFMWGMANLLKGNGASEVYFNVPVSDTFDNYRKILTDHLDAKQTSREPEFRYKVEV